MTSEYPHKTNMNVWPAYPTDPERQVTFADVCAALGSVGCEESTILAYEELHDDTTSSNNNPAPSVDSDVH